LSKYYCFVVDAVPSVYRQNVEAADSYRQLKQKDETVLMPLMHALIEGRVTDPSVEVFMNYVNDYCRRHNLVSPIDFPVDHPMEDVSRYVFAKLIEN